MGFGAAPVCSETVTMAEDPKASAVGESTQSLRIVLGPITGVRSHIQQLLAVGVFSGNVCNLIVSYR